MKLRLREVHSLKEKRAAIRPIVEGARRRYQVAAAEVGEQDRWQLASLGMACVSASAKHAAEVMDALERFVWSFPEVEVLSVERQWM